MLLHKTDKQKLAIVMELKTIDDFMDETNVKKINFIEGNILKVAPNAGFEPATK